MFFQFSGKSILSNNAVSLICISFHSLDQFLLNSRKSFLGNKYLKAITTALYRWNGSPAITSDRMRTQEYTAVICITDRSVTVLPKAEPSMKTHSCCLSCGFEVCPWTWTVPQIYHSPSKWAKEKHLLIWTDALNLQLCLFTQRCFRFELQKLLNFPWKRSTYSSSSQSMRFSDLMPS